MSDLENIIVDAEIERIVEDSIEEMEKLEADEQRYKNVSEFSNFKRMEKPPDAMQRLKDELTTQKQLNTLHNEILVNRSTSMKSEGKILEVAERNNKGISSIDSKFNKTIYSLFALFFILGICIGVLDEVWKPFLGDLLNFAKTASNVIR